MHDLRCDRFHEDDEGTHEHVTEHARKLGERLLQDSDFPYEDITGQDEPPVDSPPVPGRSTVTSPAEENQWKLSLTYGDEREEKHELSVRTNQQHRLPMLPQILHDKRQRETMMTREGEVDQPETQLSPVVQTEAPVLNPVFFDMETRNDEIAADVPLPEEPAEMSGDPPQGWIKEEALLTVSHGARQVRQRKEKTSQLTPAERREFLKSMDTVWQTLLKNHAAKVISPEETARD